jgi:3-oxoadipate enol-lactonase
MNPDIHTGFARSGHARLYFETAGHGRPFLMIHAGVADRRQWDNEFAHFSERYRAIRFDQRGFGNSEPADGEFSVIGDLFALLDHLEIDEPIIAMGCSMGGSLAMDFALAEPARVAALIMVGSGPSGLALDAPEHPLEAEAEKAHIDGDLELAAELETKIWFDGIGRKPEDVDPDMRALALEMNGLALAHGAKDLGRRIPNPAEPAAERLDELDIPVLVITGENDIPYLQEAHQYMAERIPDVVAVKMDDAAHLPNMDHPERFRAIVEEFLDAREL